MTALTLRKQSIERRWLTNKPTHFELLAESPRPLSELPPRQTDPRLSFADAVTFLSSLGDSRRLPESFRAALADELVERARLHLATFGITGMVERDDEEVILKLGGDARATQSLARFTAAWERKGVSITYDPGVLMARGFAAFARGTQLIGIGHGDVLSGRAGSVSLVHESVHVGTKQDTKKGRPSPYTGSLKARAKKGLLPGHLQGGYGAYQSIEELRTHARDLRQMVRELRRELPRLDGNERLANDKSLAGKIRNGIQVCLRTGAAVAQALGHVRRRTAEVSYKPSFADGKTWASVVVTSRRDPAGYVVTVPLVASLGSNDPGNRAHLTQQLTWARTACRGHLSLFRIAAQCHDLLSSAALADATTIANALVDILAQHRFDTAPGIAPASYAGLLKRFNATVAR